LQTLSAKNRFHRANISPRPNQRFIRALTQQKLQRADDDGFPRASFARDSDESRAYLLLELFHEREVLYSQQSENDVH